MATLTVWDNFSKRKNSTKQPTGGATVDVKLKENCSIESPVFIVRGLANANYCKYLNNYYFVDDVVYITNDIVELHCSMDAMATNKSTISSYTCFVERSQSNNDPYVIDNMLSQKSTATYTAGTEQSLSDAIDTDLGVYVVRTLGKSGITGHVMSKVTINDLMNFANDFGNYNDVFQGLDEIVDGAVKGLFNPDKYIVSCKWFPLKTSIMDLDSATNVKLGNWISNVLSPVIRSPKVVINKTIALPTPIYPDDFRKYDSNWSRVFVYLPCIGSVEISPINYPNGIGIKYITDLYTGALTVLLADADENVPIQQFTGMMGVEMPIGKAYENALSSIGGIATAGGVTVGGVAGLMAGATLMGSAVPLAGAVAGVGIMSAGKAIKASANPLATTLGGVGSIATIQEMSKIRIGIFAYDSCENVTTLGKPLMKTVQLGSLTGFVKCANASVDSIAYGKEKDIINNYLNTGFYME